MKIAIGYRLQDGPWGGGNQFGKALVAHLEAAGWQVSFNLAQPGLDIILMTEPRKELTVSAFGAGEVFSYLRRNPKTIVVHRVNECDARKNTKGTDARLLRANLCADHTVFVSQWLRDLYLAKGLPCPSHGAILNGSDTSIFNPAGHVPWDGAGPLKLVTHHWSSHFMKGFDVYRRLDEMLGNEPWRGRYEFTYVGQIPEGLAFKNSHHVKPLSGTDLADELRRHHVYVTGSQNEPGSNHQNEGALCGLPILYRQSGSMPEYCAGFGVGFQFEELEDSLERIRGEYPRLRQAVAAYPHTASRTCAAYLELFEDLIERREVVLAARRPRRRWRWLIRRAIPLS